MVAASWRNFTLFSSDSLVVRCFTATGTVSAPFIKKPNLTEAKSPDPRSRLILEMISQTCIFFIKFNSARFHILLNEIEGNVSYSTLL